MPKTKMYKQHIFLKSSFFFLKNKRKKAYIFFQSENTGNFRYKGFKRLFYLCLEVRTFMLGYCQYDQ